MNEIPVSKEIQLALMARKQDYRRGKGGTRPQLVQVAQCSFCHRSEGTLKRIAGHGNKPWYHQECMTLNRRLTAQNHPLKNRSQ